MRESEVPRIEISTGACVRCGACVELCLPKVYEQSDDGVSPARPERCFGCGHCVAACPTDAIDHERFPLDQCPLIDADALPSLDGLIVALRERRSARVFKEEPILRETVEKLLDIGRWAPSASNQQPVDWLVIDDQKRIAELTKGVLDVLVRLVVLARNPLLRPLVRLIGGKEMARQARIAASDFEEARRRQREGGDPILYHAPVLLIAHVPKGARFGRDDAAYAAYNVMLAAQRLGLGTCQIGFLQFALGLSRRLRRSLNIPPGRKPEVELILGVPKYPFRRVVPRREPKFT
jgi:nitroreductase/NAD-dependent dihydropyrimidine dehydrogenase PreA subunit